MRIVILITVLLLASACTEIQAGKSVVHEVIKQAADIELEDSIVLTCDAPTAGALRRRWGNDENAAKAWKAFCDINRKSVVP